MKKLIKKFVPKFIIRLYSRINYELLSRKSFGYDRKRYNIHSNSFYTFNKDEKLLGQIIAEYHAIEKGLVMPERRMGFGQQRLKDLVYHCNLFISKYGSKHEHLINAIRVIKEYTIMHEIQNFTLPIDLSKPIARLLHLHENLEPTEQIQMNISDYFKDVNASFNLFSESRHSLRNFEGTVKLEDIKDAVKIAQNAPSACNRQTSRVNIIQKRETIDSILKLQSGNRGFGHLADKLIVLSCELGGYLNIKERNEVYVNGGIYAMNLLYSLHFKKIGACSLNWSSSPADDMALRKVCGLSDSETIILIIACGGVPENFSLAKSHRTNHNNVIRIF